MLVHLLLYRGRPSKGCTTKANPSRGGDAKPGVLCRSVPGPSGCRKRAQCSPGVPNLRPDTDYRATPLSWSGGRLRHTTSTCRGDMGTLRATGLAALLTVLLASTSFAQQAQ